MKKQIFVFIVLNFIFVIVHASTTIDTLTLTAVAPRLITPNGDGANDKVRFELDNPEGLPVKGKIFDISGAEIDDLSTGSDPLSVLLWDGKDRSGRTVRSGIYLYQIEYKGKYLNGSVTVAR